MKKSLLVVTAFVALLSLLVGCGYQEVVVKDEANLQLDQEVKSVGVARFKSQYKFSFSDLGIKAKGGKYWKEEDLMGIGKVGYLELGLANKYSISDDKVNSLIQQAWVSGLQSEESYKYQYAGLKLGAGFISNTSPEGEILPGFEKVVAIDEELDPYRHKIEKEKIQELGKIHGVDTILVGYYILKDRLIEIIEPSPHNQELSADDKVVYTDLEMFWALYDVVTGEELVYSKEVMNDYHDNLLHQPVPNNSFGEDVEGTYLGVMKKITEEAAARNFHLFFPHYRTYYEKIEKEEVPTEEPAE